MRTIHFIILFIHRFTYAFIRLFTYLAQRYNRNLLNARIQRIKRRFILKDFSFWGRRDTDSKHSTI